MDSSEMSRKTYCFSIPGLRPLNSQDFYVGMHWGKRTRLAKDWHQITQVAMRGAGIRKVRLTDCHITITAEMSEDYIDSDNIAAKVVVDGMKRYQTSRKKIAKFTKAGLKSKAIDKIQMEGLENGCYLFQDDCWPFVVSTKTVIKPAAYDSILVVVDGVLEK